MPFLTLNTSDSQLAEYYNDTTNGYFTGTVNNPNVTKTQKPEIPNIQYVTFDDGFIRGGITNTNISAIRDIGRFSSFLTGLSINYVRTIPANTFGYAFQDPGDPFLSAIGVGTPVFKFNWNLDNTIQGPLFLIKQAGLQLSNPRLDWYQGSSVPPLAGGVNRQFTGAGILESIAGTAYGLHFDRAGLLGKIRDDQKYGGDTDNPQKGIAYRNNFSENNGNTDVLGKPYNRLVRYLQKIINVDSSQNTSVVLDRYFGGPDSLYGLGYTTVRTANDNRTIIRASDLGVPEKSLVLTNDAVIEMLSSGVSPQDMVISTIPDIAPDPNLAIKLNGFTPLTNKQIAEIKEDWDRGTYSRPSSIVATPGYNIEDKFGVNGGSNLDSINAINIVGSDYFYSNEGKSVFGISSVGKENKPFNVNEINGEFGTDLIKFRIEFLNNEKLTTTTDVGNAIANTDVLAFRAYINDFSDGVNAKWNSYRYMGRGEEFYVYDGFTRDIRVAFTIHAHNPDEMAPLYNKLNYLISTFTPDYNAAFKMRGNIGYLTVGDYIFRQPGIFTDIKIGGMMDGAWETGYTDKGAIDASQFQVPQTLKIDLSFKPIHTFLPRRNYRGKDTSGNVGQEYMAPFITQDRQVYPVLNSQGQKVPNPYLVMNTSEENSNSNSNGTLGCPGDGSSADVEKFQRWMNDNYPKWYRFTKPPRKGQYGKLGSANFGKCLDQTKKAWATYKDEYIKSQQ